MKEINTRGVIRLKDDYNFVYRIADITYIEREDGWFKYTITPCYGVIDLLPVSLFQGIPGLELDLREEVYERENIVPTFISERTPSKGREDVYALLEEYGMQSLNRLEWLIRTDKQYSGDRLYVGKYEDVCDIKVNSMYDTVKKSDRITKELLSIICSGNRLYSDEVTIDDSTRKLYYDLLMPMYIKNYEQKKIRMRDGIESAKENGVYRGRKRIAIDPLLFDKVAEEYSEQRMTSDQAAEKLGISVATFFRRMKKRQGGGI